MSDSPTTPPRDSELAELLQAQLSAPSLRPGFHDELEARLQAADVAGRDGALAASGEPRRRRFAGRRIALIAAAAAAAAILAFAVLPALRGTATATAADMLRSMNGGGGSQTIRLHIVTTILTLDAGNASAGGDSPVLGKTVEDLTMSTSGDQRMLETAWWTGAAHGTRAATTRIVSTYDELRHEMRGTRGAGAWTPNRFVITRPAWETGPTGDSVTDIADYQTLAASLRAQLAADPKRPVLETTYLGRPAWRATLDENQRWGMNQEIPVRVRWVVTVDKGTGLLMTVSFSMQIRGKPTPGAFDMRVEKFVQDPPLPQGWQVAPLPPRGHITVVDQGTRFGTPEEVAKRSWPTLPLVPQWAPAGYRLTDVASAGCRGGAYEGVGSWSPHGGRRVGRSGRFVYTRASWTMPGQTVLERFRRGFSTFVVEIAPKDFGEQIGAGTPGGRSDAQVVTLSGGFLKGARAFTMIAPDQGQGPRLITYSDRSRIVVWGDLTRQELLDVANSMKQYGDASKGIMPGY